MKKLKPTKIKRYKSIYRSRYSTKRKVLKIVGFTVIVAAVVFIGYSVAGPFMDFINGRIEPSLPSEDSSLDSSVSDTSSDASSENETPITEEQLQAVILPIETARDSAALSTFLSSAKSEGANAVVLELKDTEGILWYHSSVPQAEEYGAVSDSAVEIAPIVETIKAAGLKPVAKLSAFMDKTAPNVSRNNGYLYEDTNSAWWDNAVDRGGKPWLNPYKQAACDYLLALQTELISEGFDTILWHKVEFPEVRALSSANMGSEAEGITQQQALNNFIEQCQTQAEEKGATVFISYPVSAAFGFNESWFGGDPSGLTAENVAPELDLSTFGGSLQIGDTTIDFNDTEQALNQILSAYLAKAVNAGRIVPVITDESIKTAVLNSLSSLQIEEYIAS